MGITKEWKSEIKLNEIGWKDFDLVSSFRTEEDKHGGAD